MDHTAAGIRSEIIRKRKLSDHVKKYIRDLIIHGDIKSGQRIVETQLAKRLGVSQTPVREALRELEAMGFVEIQPYFGCFVRQISEHELYQTYQLRALLESHAVTEAIGLLAETDFQALAEQIREMRLASRTRDMDRHTVADVAFHKIIIKAAQNPLLERMWSMASVAQWTSLTIEISGRPMEFFTESHQPIYDSLVRRDLAWARREIEQHFLLCAQLVKDQILAKLKQENNPATGCRS